MNSGILSNTVRIKSSIYFYLIVFFFVFQIHLAASGNDFYNEIRLEDEIVRGELATKIDRYLSRITPFGFSGALLVAKGGKIILNKGYGLAIRSDKILNTSETVFSTGSITKQFTAAGIMKLEMQGKLKTDPA